MSPYVQMMTNHDGYGPCECWTHHGCGPNSIRHATIQARDGVIELVVQEGQRKNRGMKPIDTHVIEHRPLDADELEHVRREVGRAFPSRISSRIDAVRATLLAKLLS